MYINLNFSLLKIIIKIRPQLRRPRSAYTSTGMMANTYTIQIRPLMDGILALITNHQGPRRKLKPR